MSTAREQIDLVYRFTAVLVKVGLGIFFQRLETRRIETVPARGPVVFVANHPNSVMDALVLVATLGRKINYLAHSGLFRRGALRWFLRRCGVIPVYRREDQPGRNGENLAAFQECYEVLERGEALGIFPEGTSDPRRQVRQLKTGAARIVLEAEARNGNALGVQLIPVGLHFFSHRHFHGRVLVNIGSAVPLAEYLTLYPKEPVAATGLLTRHIQARLEQLTVNVREEEQEGLVSAMERLYRDELKVELALRGFVGDTSHAEFLITRNIAAAVTHLHDHHPGRLAVLRERIARYQRRLARLRLHDDLLKESASGRGLWHEFVRAMVVVVAGFPFALYGMITHILPYGYAMRAVRRHGRDRAKILTAMLLAGAPALVLHYAMLIGLMCHLQDPWWALLFGASLPATGFWAFCYFKHLRACRDRLSLIVSLLTNRRVVQRLRAERRRLVRTLDQIRDEYLALPGKAAAGLV